MTEEEIAEIWKKMVKEEKDKHRKMLHGSSKSITAENKFRLLKNNGKRSREEAQQQNKFEQEHERPMAKGFLCKDNNILRSTGNRILQFINGGLSTYGAYMGVQHLVSKRR